MACEARWVKTAGMFPKYRSIRYKKSVSDFFKVFANTIASSWSPMNMSLFIFFVINNSKISVNEETISKSIFSKGLNEIAFKSFSREI